MTNRLGLKRVITSVAQLLAEPTQPAMPGWLSASPPPAPAPACVSTGIRAIDKVMSTGGLPLGALTELVGPAGTLSRGGAQLVAARIAANIQRKQGSLVILDLSRGFDPWQAERAGLVAPQLFLSRPETIFEALSTLETATRHANTLIIVVMELVTDLLNHIEAERLHTLLRRLQHIVRGSDSAFLAITAATTQNPLNLVDYPPAFPLPDVARLRLWLQDEQWTFADGIATAYKTSLTVVKNDFGMVGKGANLRIKLTSR